MDSSTDDPLDLNAYVMSASASHNMENIIKASQSPSIPNPMDILSFNDFSMPYPDNSTDFQSFGSFDGGHTSPIHTNAPIPHRGSVTNFSDHNSMISARLQHTTSSPSDFQAASLDGFDQNQSPDRNLDTGMLQESLDESGMLIDGVDDDSGERNAKPKKGDTVPAWSEMKTKAGKERKRLPLACIACRRKKIRCSGEKPACKHCLRSRIPCVYKVTTRKAAPRTDYMAMLDKRLKRMEDRVIKLIPKDSQHSATSCGRSVVKPQIPAPPVKPTASKKRQADEAFGKELDDWSKSKSINPTESSAVKGQDVDENKLLTEGANSLPSKELQEHLAEVYFDHVYGQSYPLLHKPSFMRKLSAGTVPPVLILAVCAISARFSTHPSLRTEPAFLRGESYAIKAREIALKRYDTPNITILIVYLLLGLHEFGTCQGGRSWMFGGMAQRMAYALQLHRDLENDPRGGANGELAKLSSTDREIRRRTMWSCFLMDRFNSSGTDRPLFVSEQYITAQLPIKEHFFQMEITGPTENLEGGSPESENADKTQHYPPRENMGAMAYLIRLVTIWGKVIKYFNLGGKAKDPHPIWSPESEFQAIKEQVLVWREKLPECLHYNEDNLQTHATEKTANQFLYIHILYYQIILFLNRFALPHANGERPSPDTPGPFLKEAAHAALDAANHISILINEALDHNVTAPFAGYSAFFSSTVHVSGVFSKNSVLEANSKKYLAYNVKYLSKMKKVWGMFHFVAENLKDLYRQHADAALRGPSASKDSGANIFQYGDWFDRYPHGVSKTDYEDPAVDIKNERGTDAVLGQISDLQTVEEFFASLSPPSRAEAQKSLSKKAKMARSAKNESRERRASAPHDAPIFTSSQLQQQQAALLQQQRHFPPNQRHPQIPLATLSTDFPSNNNNNPYFLQSTHTGPTSAPVQNSNPHPFDTTHSAFLHQQPPLSAIDLSSSPSATSLPFAQPGGSNTLDPMTQAAMQNYWMDLAPFGPGPGYGMGEPGAAWFMPFNVDPPDLVGDEGIFGQGGLGWEGGFGVGSGDTG